MVNKRFQKEIMKRTQRMHFAYTVPMSRSIARRAIDKLLLKLRLPPLYRNASDMFIPWKQPVRSPHCISYQLLHAFKKSYKVKFYNIYERLMPRMHKGDIFVGQPMPSGGFVNESRPKTDDKGSVTSLAIRNSPNTKNFLIMPYTHDPLYISWTRDLVASQIEGLILVGGKIWERDWHLSPLKDIQIKRKIHVEMGINPEDYPVVKKSFSSKGSRKYLYIGHTAWYKNIVELERIAAKMSEYQFAHIGGGEVKGWKKLADFADLTPQFMSEIAKEYDIFVNTSTGDAQATTILEQMCFGFVVACTPETGYDHESLIGLHTSDTESNVRILKRLQDLDESEMLSIAAKNRQAAVEHHSWEEFTSKIIRFIES